MSASFAVRVIENRLLHFRLIVESGNFNKHVLRSTPLELYIGEEMAVGCIVFCVRFCSFEINVYL